MTRAHTDRNWSIYWQRCAGASFASLGRAYGITMKRARDCYLLCLAMRERDRRTQERAWLLSQGMHSDRASALAAEGTVEMVTATCPSCRARAPWKKQRRGPVPSHEFSRVCARCAVCRCGSGKPPGLCHGVALSGHRVARVS